MLMPNASAVLLWILPLLVPAVADDLGLRYGRIFLLLLPGLVLAALIAQRWRWSESGVGRWYGRRLGGVRWGRVLGLIVVGLLAILLLAALAVVGFAVMKSGFGVLMKAMPVATGGLRKVVTGWGDSIEASWIATGLPILLAMLVVGVVLGRIGQREPPARPIGREAAVVALLVGLVLQFFHWLVAAVPVLLFLVLDWTRTKPAEAAPPPPRFDTLLLAAAGFAAAWLLPTLIDQKASSLFPMSLGVGVLTALTYLLAGFLAPRLDLKLGGVAVLLGLAAMWWLGASLAFLGAVLIASGALALLADAGRIPWSAPALAALVIGAPQYWRSKVWHEYTPAWTVLAVAATVLLAVTVVLLRRRQAR